MLVADDDEEIRIFASLTLRRAGMRVVLAENGEEACALAKSEAPACIVIDGMMPVRDGLSAIVEMRGDSTTCEIPILMISSNDDDAFRHAVLAAGAQDYLLKPVAPGTLTALVARHARDYALPAEVS